VVADGEHLVDIRSWVGLMLLDIVEVLGLTPEEQRIILGEALYLDMQDYCSQPITEI
jgi:hypothetical protein